MAIDEVKKSTENISEGFTKVNQAISALSRSATLVVAANDSSAKSKLAADYVCDGTADNVEIQAAIDALPDGGGQVLLAEGLYFIAAKVLLDNYVKLAGESMDVTVLRATVAYDCVVQCHRKSYVEIADLTLDGNEIANGVLDIGANTWDPTLGGPADYILLRRLRVRNTPVTAGGYLFDIWDRSGDFTNSILTNVWVEDCIFEDAPKTIGDNIAVSYAKNVTFKNCLFEDIGTVVWGSNRSHDVTFENCRFHNITNGYGLCISGERAKIVDCYFDNCRELHIQCLGVDELPTRDVLVQGCTFTDVADTTAIGIVGADSYVENVRIIGNTLDNAKSFALIGVVVGEYTGRAKNILVANNFITNATEYGIVLHRYAEKCTIKGNQILNCVEGILVINHITTPLNHIIEGNTIWDDQETPSMLHGIDLWADADPLSGVTIANNVIKNSSKQGIYIRQTTTYLNNHISILGNTIEECGELGIYALRMNHSVIANNIIRFNQQYGIYGKYLNDNLIHGNIIYDNGQISEAPGYDGIRLLDDSNYNCLRDNLVKKEGTTFTHRYGIWISSADCDNNIVSENDLYDAGNTTNFRDDGTGTIKRQNRGYVTENSGTATLVNGQTSIVVTHGLAVTPAAGDTMVTPIESLGAATEFYIDTYTSTQFTIHVDANPTQDVDFAWKAVVL